RPASGSRAPRCRARWRRWPPSSATWSPSEGAAMDKGRLDEKEIEGLIKAGDVDTVLMVFPDQQGRFMGKRVTGDFFLQDILDGEGAIHACNYLLAVDMEMEPLPGYAYANWDLGYGDLKATPDMGTLRLVPWLEKTALVICDVY